MTAWPHLRETVTVQDVLEEGACIEGVLAFVEKSRGAIADSSGRIVDPGGYVSRAKRADGSGYGSGSGSGYGSGYGYGYGYGSGDGSGSGSGYGDGDGSGGQL